MSPFLSLHVEGTHQSWASAGAGFRKDTEAFPTRSGIGGMLCASLGIQRGTPEVDALHASIRVSSRVLRKGNTHVDYQNVRSWDISTDIPTKFDPNYRDSMREDLALPAPRQMWRTYHVDAAFQVVVEILGDCPYTPEQVLDALRHPVMPIYLGRKACRPSYPLVGADTAVIRVQSPVDVFGDVSPHVLAMHSQKWTDTRYADASQMIASLDLAPGTPPPTDGVVVPVEIGDVLRSGRARSFGTRVAHIWHRSTKEKP